MWPPTIAVSFDNVRWIYVSGAFIALAIVVGGLGVWYYRKRLLFPEQSSGAETWSFDDLRRMRERGDLTEEEYQSLRAALIGSFQGKPKTDAVSLPPDASPNTPDAEG